MGKESAKAKKRKDKKKGKKDSSDDDSASGHQASSMAQQQQMMGMHGGMSSQQHMAMMMHMKASQDWAMAQRGHMMMRPPMMMPPGGMMGGPPPYGMPGAPPFHVTPRPMPARGTSHPPRPAAARPAAAPQASAKKEQDSDSSSSSSSSSSSWPAPQFPLPSPGVPPASPADSGMPQSSPNSKVVDEADSKVAAPQISDQLRQDHLPPDATTTASGGAPDTSAVGTDAATAAASTDDVPPPSPFEAATEGFGRPRPRKAMSFNLAGAKETMAQVQEIVKAEVAVAAVRARRANTRDMATQTVRDPETMDLESGNVTIWRLRPRGLDDQKPLKKLKKKKSKKELLAHEGPPDSSGEPPKAKRSRTDPSAPAVAKADSELAAEIDAEESHAPVLTDSYGGCADVSVGA